MTLDLAGAIDVLTDLGVLPLIILGAAIFAARRLYVSFRR